MNKITYFLATAAVLASCGGQQKGYTITGTVEGAADGDTVFMVKQEGRRDYANVDTAIIADGKFVFKGQQDSAVQRYIVCKPQADSNDETRMLDFFLENGQITINMSTDQTKDAAKGTPNNDLYQGVREDVNALTTDLMKAYESMGDTTLTDEQREKIAGEMDSLEKKMVKAVEEATEKNITNVVGISLLKEMYHGYKAEELIALTEKIPANFRNDPMIARIIKHAEKIKATLPGKTFIDLEMSTPEGKAVKLSDFVGKGKVVLVDFWASWCGPCRREMPNLVEAYKQFKGKNFEIVGISLDQDGEAWKGAIKQLGISWPQMSDLKGWESEGASKYAVNSIPHTILIDAEGKIIVRGLHGEELIEKIGEALK